MSIKRLYCTTLSKKRRVVWLFIPMFRTLRSLFQKSPRPHGTPLPVHSALIDASTRAVIAVSDNVAGITFLNETLMDTYHILNVTQPNHIYALPFSLREESLVHWVWDTKNRRFNKTRPDVITESLVSQSKLAQKKLRAVTYIMRNLSLARSRMMPGIQLQETIYQAKKDQAHEFRTGGYDEKSIFQYPYVFQYADFADMSFKEAADDIILKAKLDDDFLAKTELLRLTYFDRLKKLENAAEIRPLLEAFMREAFTNSIV